MPTTKLEVELAQIDVITDYQVAKNKRTSHRGKATQCTTTVRTLSSCNAAMLKTKDIDKAESLVERNMAILVALENKCEQLRPEDVDLTAEEASATKYFDELESLLDILITVRDRNTAYLQGEAIYESLYQLNALPGNISTGYPREEFDIQKAKLHEFRQTIRNLDLTAEPELTQLKKNIEAVQNVLITRLAKDSSSVVSSPSEASVSTVPGSHSVVVTAPPPPLELPKFDGRPTSWAAFIRSVNRIMADQGSRLSENAKWTQLLKSMNHPDARRVVESVGASETCYQQALQELELKFGRPYVVYPHHVRTLTKHEVFSYDQTSFDRIRQEGLPALQGLQQCSGDTVEQFIGALYIERFDSRLRREWDLYVSQLRKLPSTTSSTSHPSMPTTATTSTTPITTGTGTTASTTKSSWEAPPSFHNVLEFLRTRELGMSELSRLDHEPCKKRPSREPKKAVNQAKAGKVNVCTACNGSLHSLMKCPTFLAWDWEQRNLFIKSHRRCLNCLSSSHAVPQCTSTYNCKQCDQRHHTLLHKSNGPPVPSAPARTSAPVNSAQPPVPPSASVSNATVESMSDKPDFKPPAAFLATALVGIPHHSCTVKARALLDQGATVSLISEELAATLKLLRQPYRLPISGVYGSGLSKHYVIVQLSSLFDSASTSLEVICHVLPRLSSADPPSHVEYLLDLPCIRNKTPLADPFLGGSIDLLLGARDVARCTVGPHSLSADHVATPTIFGWTLYGAILDEDYHCAVLHAKVADDHLDELLAQQWELDKVHSAEALQSDDAAVVAHFHDTVKVLPSGRLQVCLPHRQPLLSLRETRPMAMKRFLSNEKMMAKKGKLGEFRDVLHEYLLLGHAEEVPQDQLIGPAGRTFYLPAHGVCKESSTTTKLRAVFDGSVKSSNQLSLNDTLLPGPNIYQNIFDVLVRFRSHVYVLTSDISKMFRCISLHPSERDLHRFLMRRSDGSVGDYRMTRVTFGITSSPYLATQSLHYISDLHKNDSPEASAAIRNFFYVDDFLAGADSVDELTKLAQEVSTILESHGFVLRKWRSNSLEVIQQFPEELCETDDWLQIVDPRSTAKALGMHWSTHNDALFVSVPLAESVEKYTKRQLASTIARIYDVLGLLCPAIISARILLRKVWQEGVGWDEVIPAELMTPWQTWVDGLKDLALLPMPRSLKTHSSLPRSLSLHGFSDASEKAYGAAVYLRTVYQDAQVTVSLVAAKARVTKMKTETIPRLELVAARLLMQLLVSISSTLSIPIVNVYAWSDSMIVLAWLRKNPSQLKTFVAHRVNDITKHIPADHWRHVRSEDNPADLASRGIPAQDLLHCRLWWHGPKWLSDPPLQWPGRLPEVPSSLLEIKIASAVVSQVNTGPPVYFLWTKYSSFPLLCKVVGYIQRFALNSRQIATARRRSRDLYMDEITTARCTILRASQRQTYSDVIESVQKKKTAPASHHLRKLDLVLSPEGLLLAQGRVRCEVTGQPKPRIILSLKSPITRLLVSSLHRTLRHPGVTTLLAAVSDKYYIPGLRNFLKFVSRTCVICQKAYSKTVHQKMGLLPDVRTTPTRPFSNVGVDFAGPVYTRQGHVRKPVKVKTYLCVFICLCTKAVHLDVCEDLSTEAFMATFSRFIARRGKPSRVFSDNGTNFSGTKAEIQELQRLLFSKETSSALVNLSATQHIEWDFIPPRTPHFGGLWEAAVKSMKVLLKKLLQAHSLTPMQLYTVLTEAEAILNSRPICPMYSGDPEEPVVLTAAHFLVGDSLLSMPRAPCQPIDNKATVRHWKLVSRLMDTLWTQWRQSYLQSLQTRNKWHRLHRNFAVGDVVLLKDDSLSTRSWPLALITAVHPGKDGVVRVVDVRSQQKIYRRSVDRLILLIAEDEQPGRPPVCPGQSGQPEQSTT